MDEALEEEHGSAGQPVAQLWIHGIGRDVSLIGVQADTYEGNLPANTMYPRLGYRLAG